MTTDSSIGVQISIDVNGGIIIVILRLYYLPAPGMKLRYWSSTSPTTIIRNCSNLVGPIGFQNPLSKRKGKKRKRHSSQNDDCMDYLMDSESDKDWNPSTKKRKTNQGLDCRNTKYISQHQNLAQQSVKLILRRCWK